MAAIDESSSSSSSDSEDEAVLSATAAVDILAGELSRVLGERLVPQERDPFTGMISY